MQSLTILIVDDDTTTSSILKHMLSPFGETIHSASNGVDGLNAYQRFHPDIILSDINMPEMNGLEMVEKIRMVDEEVKIALFTDFERRDILLKAIELGVNQFLSKPFHQQSFSKIMQNLCTDVIDKRQTNQELQRQQNILHAINQMAHNFLQQSNWMEALQDELLNLKKAAQVSSIFIYQNGQDKRDLQAHKLLYINDNKQAKSKKNIHYRKHNLMRWKNKLEKKLLINGNIDDYDKSKTKLLSMFKINSLLILPIFVQNKWWGFLGIGDEDKETLETSNVGMLETAASIIGAAINNRYNLQSLEMSSAVFEHTMDGVLITDSNNNIVHVNDAFIDITGYPLEYIIGKNPGILKSGKHDKHFFQKLWFNLQKEGYWQGEITNRKKSGEVYIEWLSINAIKNSQGEIENFIGIFSDVTHQRKDAQTQAYLATHDPLTGLSNRLLFNDRLEHAIAHAKRFKKCVSLIFCDLDNFKPINDTYGHTVGDEILKRVALALKKILRKEDTVCRFGGDEFVILVEELNNFTYLDNIINKINSITHSLCLINEHTIPIGMSIGASIYPDDGRSAGILLDAADTAMYRAKNRGKNRIEYAQLDIKQYCLHPDSRSLNYSI